MSHAPPDVGTAARAQAVRLLGRIAAVLGEPAIAFLDGSPQRAAMDQADELMRIWERLHHDHAARQRLLSLARTLDAERDVAGGTKADL